MDLLIQNAILDTTLEPVNIGIRGGKIIEVGSGEPGPADQVIDAEGCMASPAFVEAHFHLENALLWDLVNQSGTLKEAIDLYAGIKRGMSTEDIVRRARKALDMSLLKGVLWFRNHVDIDPVGGLRLLKGVVQAREHYRGLMDIQNISFPQLGLARNPQAVDLMWQAMEEGADVVGGMPHGEKDMDDAARHIEIAFEIARKHNADIDMHVDETDDPYWHTLELLAEKTIEAGWQGRVTAGHCCAMSAWDDALAERVIEKVRQAQITVVTNAPVNLMLQGRGDRQPRRRGITRVKELLEAGVNVACGQDDMLNMFYSFGNMDSLEVALMVCHAAHLSAPHEVQAAFDMPRYNAARARRIPDYGIHPGAPASLVILDAGSAVDALRRHADRRWVIANGRVLARTNTVSERNYTP